MKRAARLSVFFMCVLMLFSCMIGCSPSKEDDPLQQACGKRCAAYFKQEKGEGVFDDQEHSGAVSYKFHYNKKMNACFILLDENGYKRKEDKLYEMKSLWDMKEKKKYGLFFNMGTSTSCHVLEKKCASEDEWDKLVAPLMEE